MHLGLAFIILGFAFWKGDWRNWQKYGLTLFYVMTCNLLYNHFCNDYLLWKYTPDIFPSTRDGLELMYTFIILPANTLIYLTNYPYSHHIRNQFLYLFGWVFGSFLITAPFVLTNRLVFSNGYESWMDIYFYIVMYFMIRLHQTRMLLTYCLSIIFIVFLLWYFKVPFQ